GGAVAGPVDTTAAVAGDPFRSCLEEVAADDGVDALLVVTVPTAIADLTQAVAAARIGKPLAAAVLNQPEAVRLMPVGDPQTPLEDGAATDPQAGDFDRPAPRPSPGPRALPTHASPR